RDARGVDHLLAFGFARAAAFGARRLAVRFLLRLIAGNGVLGDVQDAAVQQAVSGKSKRLDLYLGLLAGMHEADVAIRHHRLDLQMAVERHDDKQRLCRRHDAPHRVDCKLLHDAVFGSRERLQLGSLLGFDQVLDEAARFLLGLYQLVVDGTAELGDGLRARFDDRRHGRFRLMEATLLYLEVLLLIDELLKRFEILQLRAEFPAVKGSTDVYALLDDRNDRFQLGDAGGLAA